MKIKKGTHELDVTEKAFNVVYKHMGYEKVEEKKTTPKRKVVKDDRTE